MFPLIAPMMESSTTTDNTLAPAGPIVRAATASPTRSVAAIAGTVITFR